MYSVVLMMTMTGGAEVPDFHRRNRCCCCSSCCCSSWCGGVVHGCCSGYCTGRQMPQRPKQENIQLPKKTSQAPAPATLIVNLPANARLLVDDHLTSSTSAQRKFQTPALEPGQTYVYTLRAEVERDGRTVTATRPVTLRAGEQLRVTISFTSADVAAAR